MNRSARWSVVVLVVLVALGVAFWRELGDDEPTSGARAVETSRDHRDADTPEALAGPRARADLAPCPGPGPGPGSEALRGITLECVGDGSPVDVGRATDGRAVVLNLWAYW